MLGSSSSTGYLTSDVLKRPNLTISTGAVAEKVIFSTEEGIPRAVGVEVSTSERVKKHCVRATKEVILCAGAISSPHLLFVSGVGSQEALELAGVPLVKNLPAVGKHLLDVTNI